jgi:hypothetical protein
MFAELRHCRQRQLMVCCRHGFRRAAAADIAAAASFASRRFDTASPLLLSPLRHAAIFGSLPPRPGASAMFSRLCFTFFDTATPLFRRHD